jgi:hypothetical protein
MFPDTSTLPLDWVLVVSTYLALIQILPETRRELWVQTHIDRYKPIARALLRYRIALCLSTDWPRHRYTGCLTYQYVEFEALEFLRQKRGRTGPS